MAPSEHTVTVTPEDQGQRLDKFLAGALPDLSRSRVKSLILEGCVQCDGATVAECDRLVKPGEAYSVQVPKAAPTDMQPADIPLNVVFEDEHLLVIDKPAGLTTHPGAGNHQDTLANALLAHCGDSLSGIGGEQRPGIVHRLDKDTSGLLVVAKHDKAHQKLAKQIEKRTLKRVYLAVVWGVPSPMQGLVDAPIGRSPRNRKKMAVVKSGGKEAVTHYNVLQVYNMAASLVQCQLETGRTHQIRVHMTHLGHALIGDQSYGNQNRKLLKDVDENMAKTLKEFPRQALHSHQITFTHPESGEEMHFESTLPEDIKELAGVLEKL